MIRLQGVAKQFDRPVLTELELCVPEGCLYGLIGPPGVGKSLSLKLITGLVAPDRGRVLAGETEVSGLDPLRMHEYRKGIGMLFQNNALFDFMTVGENVAFPLQRLFSPSRAQLDEAVGERLARVGLSALRDAMPKSLSGGQRKRVGVARATVTRAPILLYDEPAAGLDPVTSQRIFDLLRAEQRARASTVIMVSSDLDRLLQVTDRVGMLFGGRLIFDGTTEELWQSRDPYVEQFVRGGVEGPL